MNGWTPSVAEDRVGAGSRALAIFAHSLNGTVLRAHTDHSLGSAELGEILRWAPETSLRLAVKDMRSFGALVRLEPTGAARFPTSELTLAGRELLLVANALETWLFRSPYGPLALEGTGGPSAIKALIAGWDSTMVRELAERSLTLTELSAKIAAHSYPSLSRRLSKLRTTNLVTPALSDAGGKGHEVSDWLRHGAAPLSVAGSWEHRHKLSEAGGASRGDLEAIFMLTLPLVELAPDVSGTCALTVLMPAQTGPWPEGEVAGVSIGVAKGRVVSCVASTTFNPASWALGSPEAWHEALIDGRLGALRFRGAIPGLPEQIVERVHDSLFPF